MIERHEEAKRLVNAQIGRVREKIQELRDKKNQARATWESRRDHIDERIAVLQVQLDDLILSRDTLNEAPAATGGKDGDIIAG